MEKSKFVVQGLFFLIMIDILYLISVILTLCGKEWVGFGVLLLIFIGYTSYLIAYRKKLFAKMLIDSNGIRIFYREKLLKQIKWHEVSDCLYQRGVVVFTDSLNSIKDKRSSFKVDNNILEINLMHKKIFAEELHKHLNKVPVKIRGLEKLPKHMGKYFKDYLENK